MLVLLPLLVTIRTVRADSDTEILGGCFETVFEPIQLAKIAIGICTFRREEFVKKTLETLKRETMENPDSPLYQNVYVYVHFFRRFFRRFSNEKSDELF